MDHDRWAFSLSHCPVAPCYYQPNRDNNPQDYASDPFSGPHRKEDHVTDQGTYPKSC